MNRRIILLVASVVALHAAQAAAHGMSLIIENGKCVDLTLPHVEHSVATRVCSGKVVNAVLSNGRVVFTFTSKRGSPPLAISFAGNGSEQFNPSKNVSIQPIDAVDFNVGLGSNHVRAFGKCIYNNPYRSPGKGYIRCSARTSLGIFAGILIDGRVPTE